MLAWTRMVVEGTDRYGWILDLARMWAQDSGVITGKISQGSFPTQAVCDSYLVPYLSQ